jgi:hypothetical protein
MGFLLALPGRVLLGLVWFGGLGAALATGLLRRANPMRYSIASGGILAIVPPYVMLSNNSLLSGLFVLETTDRVMNFTAMSMVAALTVVGTFQAARLSETNQERREPPEYDWGRINWAPLAAFLILGLIAPACAGRMTWLEYPGQYLRMPIDADYPNVIRGTTYGIGVGLVLACLLGVYQGLLTPRHYSLPGIMPFEFRLRGSSARRARTVEPSVDADAGELPGGVSSGTASGRVTLGSLLAMLMLLYVVLMFLPHASPDAAALSYREVPGAASRIPAGFFALLLHSIVTLVLAGAAFACDRRRIPTTVIVVLLILPAFSFPAADSYFALVPADEPPHASAEVAPPAWVSVYSGGDPAAGVPAVEPGGGEPGSAILGSGVANSAVADSVATGRVGGWVFPDRSRPQNPQPTMVVVVAPGGGIQAAAWTTQVLTGLDALYEDFSESIGLLSSVSGGSVGVMYYLVGRGDRLNAAGKAMTIDDETRDDINEKVRASSLDAVAWALTYPKIVRPYRLFVPTDLDHGWALKTSWHLRLRQLVREDAPDENRFDDRLYLRGWCEKIRRGKAPPFVFNATVIETGKRLTITPVTPARNDKDEDFLSLFPDSAPHLATAARLSAAFPYVSPSSRALPIAGRDEPEGFHIVDGGYADNEGIVTAVEWIQELLDHRIRTGVDLPFKRILILRLQPFQDSDENHRPLGPLAGTLLGPALAINNARGASQVERGGLEASLLIAATETKQVERRRRESENATRVYESELAKSRPSVQNSMKRYPDRPRGGPPAGTSVGAGGAEARQYGMAMQMAADDSKNWYERPEVRNRLKASLAGKVDDSTLRQFDREEEKEALRVSALEDKSERIKELAVIPVYAITIKFESKDVEYREPLSWKLTPRQDREISDAWIPIRDAILEGRERPPGLSDKVEARELNHPAQLNRFFKLR